MKQILIVEDDISLCGGLQKALMTNDRQIVACTSSKDAISQLSVGMPSLIVLDINLPDGNGLDLMSKVKQAHPEVPVILLTANDTEHDVIKGLECGADDYITKPFSLSVLRARVNTQLRKTAISKTNQIFRTNHHAFNFQEMIFSVDGCPIELSKTEQKLLRILTNHAGITLSRDTLIDYIWTDGAEYVDENALSVAVKRLRDKLKAHSYIKTIYGVGYSWIKEDE